MVDLQNLTRRVFLSGAATTATTIVLPKVTQSFAADYLSEEHTKSILLPIVTSRAVYGEAGHVGVEVKNELTRQQFNFLENQFGFSDQERFAISSPFSKEYLQRAKTINLIFHGFNTGWEDAITFGEKVSTAFQISKRTSHLDIVIATRSMTVDPIINPASFWLLPTSRIAARLPFEYSGQYYTESRAGLKDAYKIGNFIAALRQHYQGSINVIAHSLGGRNALAAIKKMARTKGIKHSENDISQFILLSPDITYRELNEDWPEVHKVVGRTTVYTSEKDLALYIGGIISTPGDDEPRKRIGVPLVPDKIPKHNFDLLMYNSRTSFLNHSFFFDVDRIKDDMFELIQLPRGKSTLMKNRRIAKGRGRARVINPNRPNILKMN